MFWEWGGICPEFPWAMISCAAALMYQPEIHLPKPSYPSCRLFYRVPPESRHRVISSARDLGSKSSSSDMGSGSWEFEEGLEGGVKGAPMYGALFLLYFPWSHAGSALSTFTEISQDCQMKDRMSG